MSRIGNRVVEIPAGVTVSQNGNVITVKGPKGELTQTIDSRITLELNGNELVLKGDDTNKEVNMLHGTTRANIHNMVVGVSTGFKKELIIVGVGYRATLKGKTLVIEAGYSHDVEFAIPEGITVELPKNTDVIVSGIDKQKVGQFAANIRAVREPEPYHGKGIHYSDEVVRRKEGKKAKK